MTATAQARTAAPANFSPVEGTLYGLLKLDKDVPIADLHAALVGEAAAENVTFRQQQQAVGKYISRINAKIAERRELVAPGVARRTYRLRKMRK